jgi:hypothetical protein
VDAADVGDPFSVPAGHGVMTDAFRHRLWPRDPRQAAKPSCHDRGKIIQHHVQDHRFASRSPAGRTAIGRRIEGTHLSMPTFSCPSTLTRKDEGHSMRRPALDDLS